MNQQKIQNILVYTDFTEVGEKSIEWGIYLASKFQKELHIIHVINNNSYNYFEKSNILQEVNQTLSSLCSSIKEKHNISCSFYVEEGCTCTIINSEAERNDSLFVILGHHGKNDLQYLSGVAEIKIIRKSRIPYFVIQKNSPLPKPTGSIVMPLGIQKEMKEKTGWVSYFSKHISTHIDILYNFSDETGLKNNIQFCTNFFRKYDLNFEKIPLPKRVNLDSESTRYAKNEDSLMLVTITTKKDNLFHKIFGLPETKTISNSYGIPILCINPKKDLYIPCI